MKFRETEKFEYEIVKKIAVLSHKDNTSMELNFVSFNRAAPKYDIRVWLRRPGQEERLLRGIALTDAEVRELKQALMNIEI